jgi:hypothetical protein
VNIAGTLIRPCDPPLSFFINFNVMTFVEALEFRTQFWRHKSFITDVIREGEWFRTLPYDRQIEELHPHILILVL